MKPPRLPFLIGLAITSSLLATEAVKTATTVPDANRVPFPRDYQKAFQEVRASNKMGQTKLGTIYANVPAASILDVGKLPYPDGSVFVMEWADPVKGANGELQLDPNGNWKKGAVTRIDMMRREKGFGAVYGGKRAGEWAFASYTSDGEALSPTPDFAACAECHAKAAARDFVFRGRFPELAK